MLRILEYYYLNMANQSSRLSDLCEKFTILVKLQTKIKIIITQFLSICSVFNLKFLRNVLPKPEVGVGLNVFLFKIAIEVGV